MAVRRHTARRNRERTDSQSAETAKANGIEPFAYLEQVFTRLAAGEGPIDYAELLPWFIALPER